MPIDDVCLWVAYSASKALMMADTLLHVCLFSAGRHWPGDLMQISLVVLAAWVAL